MPELRVVEPLRDALVAVGAYAELPEVLKQYYSEKEYLWLPDAAKARMEREELEPETFTD